MKRKNNIKYKGKNYSEIIMDTKNNEFTVLAIDRKNNKSIYFLRGNSGKIFNIIELEGFLDFPVGIYLNRNGYGFKNSFYFFKALRSQFPSRSNVSFVISRKDESKIIGTRNITVIISLDKMMRITNALRDISTSAAKEMQEKTNSFLSTIFPKKIKLSEEKFDSYIPGSISNQIQKSDFLTNINETDLEQLTLVLPKLFDPKTRIAGRITKIKDYKIRLANKTRKITEKIYLKEVISEFRKKLKQTTISEQSWQIFLRDKVLPFNTSYVKIIEKQNIGLKITLPDFLLIDIYGFLDVYEIKTQNEKLLSFDKSHGNYYWKSEISKAISQIENYIHILTKNADIIMNELRKKHNISINIVKPRGFVVVGKSEQLKTEEEKTSYRLLTSAYKNIDFILYDDLLKNLESLAIILETK